MGSGEWPGQLDRDLKEKTRRSGLRNGSRRWTYESEHQVGRPLHYIIMPALTKLEGMSSAY